MKNWELENFFYETATPEERSEMRVEMYESVDEWDDWDEVDDYDWR